MDNAFSDKVRSFSEWSVIAFEHFGNAYYADSLTNMRKCGETACKILIQYKYSARIAENKIARKSYKELIEVVIKDGLAPRKVINWLETLQIHGNAATHDTHIEQEQSYYGIVALKLLVYWLYVEFLQTPIPSKLQSIVLPISDKSNDGLVSERIEEERAERIKEKEELEKKLKHQTEKNEKESEIVQHLTNELNLSVQKIKELDAAQNKISDLENALSQYKIEAERLKQKNDISFVEQGKKKRTGKLVVTLLIAVTVIVSAIIVYKNVSPPGKKITENPMIGDSTQLVNNFKVLIFPLQVLQDNPNIKINFEEALINRIRQYSFDLKLPIEIIYKSSAGTSGLSKTDIFDKGLKENAIVVFYGELYEPVNNDSTQVNIKNILIRDGKPCYDETGMRSFGNLADSSAIRIMQELECIINFTIAEDYVGKNKHSDALALLYHTVPIIKSQKWYYSNFLAECQMALNNYQAAVVEIQNLINLEPDSAYSYAFMGNVLSSVGDSRAESFYQHALQLEPNNGKTIVNYADYLMMQDTGNSSRVRPMLEAALKFDEKNANIYRFLAELENLCHNYATARQYYYRALELQPDNKYSKRNLASLLAFQLYEPEEAVKYINEILSTDSNDLEALYILANIYTYTRLKDLSTAEYLLKKSSSLDSWANAHGSDYGLGLNASKQGDYKKALSYFLKVYSVYPDDAKTCNNIGQTYMALKDYVNAEKYLLFSSQLDSMNYLTNYNLGMLYMFAEGSVQNWKKAACYFEKELETYPYDTLAIQWLGAIYCEHKNIPKLKEVEKKLQKLTPNSAYRYKLLGLLSEYDSDGDLALLNYKKAAELCNDDAELFGKIAYLLMNDSTKEAWRDALKFAGQAVALIPDNADYNYLYSKALLYWHDIKKSSEYYYRGVDIDPAVRDTDMEQIFKIKGVSRL
ncbi:MAG: hypothetical protein KKA07_01285 [Bacteroidetes bacterium]|nr:hypothetical protein [Bacteroidota bacterium]MBU1717682.1 hypothetical protein [Bacteroidota bacterium]